MNKKGFTLFEMTIVFALIGIMFSMVMYFAKDSRTPQIRAERFATAIYDMIRTTKSNMTIWRGVMSGSSLAVVSERYIAISTGAITPQYKNTSWVAVTETGVELRYPFFDNDKSYMIKNIAVSSGGMSTTGLVPAWDSEGLTSAKITVSPNADLSLTGSSGPSNIRTLKITAGYQAAEYSVIIDKLTGVVEMRGMNFD